MKELYISPELEILCFLPAQGIASTFGQQSRAQLDNGLSNEESRPGDFNQPVNPGEDLFG